MSQSPAKMAIGSTASALLAHAALYWQLVSVELQVEKMRLLQMALILLAGFSLLTSLLVALTTSLLLASWDTPYRAVVLLTTLLVYGAGIVLLWLRFSALAVRGDQAFCDTRDELAEDLALLRSRLEQ